MPIKKNRTKEVILSFSASIIHFHFDSRSKMDLGDVDVFNSVWNESSLNNLQKMIQDLMGNSSDSHIGLGKLVHILSEDTTQ